MADCGVHGQDKGKLLMVGGERGNEGRDKGGEDGGDEGGEEGGRRLV